MRQSLSTSREADTGHGLLQSLLKALNWKGDPRYLQEVLCEQGSIGTIEQLRNAMANLGYRATLIHEDPARLKERHFPLLRFDAAGQPAIMTAAPKDRKNSTASQLMLFEEIADEKPLSEHAGLFRKLHRFTPQLAQITLYSLLIGIMALAPTLYNMTVYDHVISRGSIVSLPSLAAGVVLALAAELFLRHMRSRRLAYFGARMDHYISNSVFERLLFLPPLYSERSSASSQLARLRDFEAVREFFTGPLSSLFFELPLIVLYTTAMALLAGPLAWTPVALVAGYGVVLWSMSGRLRDTAQQSAEASTRRQEFMLETLTKLRAIRLNGMEKIWSARYRQLSTETSVASFNALQAAQVVEVISYVLMTLGAVTTLTLGVEYVMQKEMTAGALIASMMLIWRIVAPLQMCCASVTRLQQLKASAKQALRLLSFVPEHNPHHPVADIALKGRIAFSRVSMRYTAEAEPALLGVGFDIRPGQVVAIRGNNGSGKSSILKLILGLYQPQGGSVRLDGMDLRQLDPVALRQSIAYIPQHMELLPGTIRDNLHYADPSVTDRQCLDALREACALDEFNQLPHGLDTVVAGDGAETISFMLKQRLNIARAYLKPAKIMLFDEASHSLGRANDLAFARMIETFRGQRTIVMVTHREDHMRMADLVLEKGELVRAGPPEQIMLQSRGGAR